MERLLGHRERQIPSLRRSRGDVSPALDSAFQSLMAKSADGRPQTMGAVIQVLEACRSSLSTTSSRLLVFDDRDEETRKRDETYQVARKKVDRSEPKSEVLTNVFVRSRGSSTDRIEGSWDGKKGKREGLYASVLILAVILFSVWYLLRG
jgi:hypothetical protein